MKTPSRAHSATSRFNGWKWSFIGLLAIILGCLAFAVSLAVQRPGSPAKSQPAPTQAAVSVTMTKQQLNALATYYLKKVQKNPAITYQFRVADAAYVTGTTKMLGANVPYVLRLQPRILANGDVDLKADQLKVGALPLPIKAVMGYIQTAYELPRWVSLDTNTQTVHLRLTQIGGAHHLSYSAQTIDFSGSGRFTFQVHIPKTA